MKIASRLLCCVVFVVLVLTRVQAQDQPKDAKKEIAADKAKKAEDKAKAKRKDAKKDAVEDKAKKADVKAKPKATDARKEIAATIASTKSPRCSDRRSKPCEITGWWPKRSVNATEQQAMGCRFNRTMAGKSAP